MKECKDGYKTSSVVLKMIGDVEASSIGSLVRFCPTQGFSIYTICYDGIIHNNL